MSLIAFGIIFSFGCLASAAVAFDEGRRHERRRAKASDYNAGHSDGFEDGWNAAQQVNRVIREVGHGASW